MQVIGINKVRLGEDYTSTVVSMHGLTSRYQSPEMVGRGRAALCVKFVVTLGPKASELHQRTG